MARLLLVASWSSLLVAGQLAGTTNTEMPPPVPIARCDNTVGCSLEVAAAVLDANWRWVHGQNGDCYNAGGWNKAMCPTPEECTENCAVEGVDSNAYSSTYGVSPIDGGLRLNYVEVGGPGGGNVGSRLYLLDDKDPSRYKMFKLRNREFTFEVDVSNLPCGLNGAVYFSAMDATGDLGLGNKAGAKYGTGYCDAQCPHDIKYILGDANIDEWNSTGAIGKSGACCTEMDLWEANSKSTAYTAHTCEHPGMYKCKGVECGDIHPFGRPEDWDNSERWKGVCDKDGCDFNSYRLGHENFYGKGPEFQIDTTKPVTVVTQFVTADGTDSGDLVEIRRLYFQGGQQIRNSNADVVGSYDSISDEFCAAAKSKFDEPNDFMKKGGLRALGEAMDQGLVLVMSLWDDHESRMLWLDSTTGKNASERSKLGARRGSCSLSSGDPQVLRSGSPQSHVMYTNIMYGEIGSTYSDKASTPGDLAAKSKDFTDALKAWKAGPTPPGQQPMPMPLAPTAPGSSAGAPAVQGQSASGGCGAAFAQCGGNGFTGAKCCQEGCACVAQGDFYAQCHPPGNSYLCSGTPQTALTPASVPITAAPVPLTAAPGPLTAALVPISGAPVPITAAPSTTEQSSFAFMQPRASQPSPLPSSPFVGAAVDANYPTPPVVAGPQSSIPQPPPPPAPSTLSPVPPSLAALNGGPLYHHDLVNQYEVSSGIINRGVLYRGYPWAALFFAALCLGSAALVSWRVFSRRRFGGAAAEPEYSVTLAESPLNAAYTE